MPEELYQRENFTNDAIFRGLEFADGQSKTSPDSLVFPQKDETKHVIVSDSETIQSIDNQKQLQGNKYAPTSKSKISVLPQGVDMRSNSLAPCGRGQGEGLKATFIEPSRGMSGAKVEQTSAETLSFRCVCERCRFTRGEGATHVAHLENSRKIAFTLAEVLITLGIIGVVAALTLPTLIQNYQKTVLVTQLKKEINTISNVYKIALATEGVDSMYDSSFHPPVNAITGQVTNGAIELDKLIQEYAKVTDISKNTEMRDVVCSVTGSCNLNMDKIYLLNDGGCIIPTSAYGVEFVTGEKFERISNWYLDVNCQKGPNKAGRDIFELMFDQYGKLIIPKSTVCLPTMSSKDIDDLISETAEANGMTKDEVEKAMEDDMGTNWKSEPSVDCLYSIINDGWKMNY